MKKNNNTENFKSFWIKYDNYELVDIEDTQYITPTEDSKVQLYDPFDYADDILVDILTIGKMVANNKFDSAPSNIVNFAKKYGLLGHLTYLPLNENFLMSDKVYLAPDAAMVLDEIMDTEKYVNLFIMKHKKQKINITRQKDNSTTLTIENEVNPIVGIDRPQEYAIVYSKVYSETTLSFLIYAHSLYSTFRALERYGKEKNEFTKKQFLNSIKAFQANKIACKILVGDNEDDLPVLEWKFNSLRLAIDTIFALNVTNEKKTVKLCKHCEKPFSSDNLKSEYCSPQCRNRANVYKSRAKNK